MERTTSLDTEPSQTFAIGWKSNNYKSYTRIYNRELKQPPQRQQQERHKFAYFTTKTIVLHTLHMHSSVFYISLTFSFFLWREMTGFAVVWTTWAYDDKCSILSCYLKALVPIFFNCRIVRTHFASVMTLNNCEIIAETWSYIFRWHSRCCQRHLCLSSVTLKIWSCNFWKGI